MDFFRFSPQMKFIIYHFASERSLKFGNNMYSDLKSKAAAARNVPRVGAPLRYQKALLLVRIASAVLVPSRQMLAHLLHTVSLIRS